MRSVLGIAILLLLLGSRSAPLRADLEPGTTNPYLLQIVLVVDEHRFLSTEAFRERFPAALLSQVQLALGPLVRCEVTRSHPLVGAIREDGLGPPLDAWDEIAERRTWFLVVRFEAGRYEVRARFFDGYTGLPGPLVLSAQTNDREQLASEASRLLIDRFPLVGTVVKSLKDQVEMRLLGADVPGGDLPRHLRTGDVFAVSRIVSQGGRLRAQRLPWMVLEGRSAGEGGMLTCRVQRRFQEDPFEAGPGVVGFRALLLPARSLPLRLRVVDRDTTQPLPGLSVQVRSSSGAGLQQGITDTQGIFVTPAPVDRLALVKLTQGTKSLSQQVPIALLDDNVVTCQVSSRPEADEAAALEIRRLQWLSRLLDDLKFADQRTKDLSLLLTQSLERAQEHARESVSFLDRELEDLRFERDQIARLHRTLNPDKKSSLEGEQILGDLAQRRESLHESVGSLGDAIKKRDELTTKQQAALKLAEQAMLLESQSLADEALDLYAQALKTSPGLVSLAKRADALRRAWEIKGDAHASARKYLIEEWPRLDTEQIPLHLNLADEALKVCRQVDDRLTPKRFRAATLEHLPKIAAIVENLRRLQEPEDRRRLQVWEETIATLRRLSSLPPAASPSKTDPKADPKPNGAPPR